MRRKREGKDRREAKREGGTEGRREREKEGRRSGGRETIEQTQVPKMSERMLPFPGFKELDTQALDSRIKQYT